MDKRNLSGIFIITQENGKNVPICIEEAPEKDQDRWLDSLEKKALVHTCKSLMETLNKIAEAYGIYRQPETD